MKHFALSLFLILLFLPALQAQQKESLSRFSIGFDVGSGNASHNCCYETWGYFNMGFSSAYRLKRTISLEADLRYIQLEGSLSGYSKGQRYSLTGFQQLHNAILLAGPSLHIPLRKGMEISLMPKAGMMLNNISQDINNFNDLYETRRYKPNLLFAYEANARLSWWFTERLAFESTLGYMRNFEGNKSLQLASVKSMPTPFSNLEYPEFFINDITQHRGKIEALTLFVGLRYRL